MSSRFPVTRALRRAWPFGAGREGGAGSGVVLLIALLVGLIFGLDVLLLPLGVAGGVPYVIPVLMTMWLPARRLVLPVAVVCSILTVADYGFSPPAETIWVAIPNRILALVAIWSVALLARERQRIEAALARSEARARAVLSTTADAILTLDGGGRITSANPAAERVFGHRADDLVGRSFGDLLGPGERARFERDREAYLEGISSDTTREAEGLRREGGAFPLELAVVPHAGQRRMQYTATVRDISDRRLIEQHLLRTSEEERRAIGQGLHEELGQVLTGLHLISRHLARRLAAQNAGEADAAADLATMLQEADALALRLFRSLVPVDATAGLPEALRRLAHETSRLHGLPCRVVHDAALPPLEELHAIQLFRIVQDAVSWALQSGRVHDVEVRVGAGDGGAHLTVHLRGDVGDEFAGWPGVLKRLEYRANLIGTRIGAHAAPEGGLLVSCAP